MEGNESNLSKKEFLKHPNMKSLRKEINGCGICIFVLAAINIAFTFFMDASSWLDVILMIVLGLGIYFLQSRVCSIIFTVYGVINVIYYAINNGRFGGYLFLIAGVYSCIYTFKFHKAWKEYKKTGVIPG